jgi:predicted nucleic acid-binding protein
MKGYIFDTNIFNHILDGQVDLSFLEKIQPCYTTHLQNDELQATKDVDRKSRLLAIFKTIPQKEIATESFVLGHSGLGMAKLGKGNLYNEIKKKLDDLNDGRSSNVNDALIAETAIINGLTFVTDDGDLYEVVNEYQSPCINLDALLHHAKTLNNGAGKIC